MPKKVTKLNLSDHTLDINTRKCNYEKFDFSEIEDFVQELAGGRPFQFNAIKQIMIYLWGDSYKDVSQLAKENYKKKEAIQQRFQSEENFLRHLPLPNHLSGVVHMATGTGKSYILFAVAYLSVVMGKTKRVLILGPSSTVIEQGLTGKFREYLYGKKGLQLQGKLPLKYSNIPINLLNENDPIEDNSIVIENINSIYNKENNSIGDTLFVGTDEVLVLSDEVHHAYSHLTYRGNMLDLEETEGKGETRDERLWMKFIREEQKITRHIGFTGTPYNQDEYFADVIYDYSINDATNEKVIKRINPIIKTEAEDGDTELNINQKFEQILITHDENKKKYSYSDDNDKPRLKPITVFINGKQTIAEKNTELFTKVLADYLKVTKKEFNHMPASQLYQVASEKVICVISKPTDTDYQEKLDAIEEIDPAKPGGKVEFVFAVNKLSEGWDVDNVYQIVPMEERVFNSKLLISQVLGRGLRLPRNVPLGQVFGNYPIVTITNHEKFAEHIKELLYAVTDCETRFVSKVMTDTKAEDRAKHNFKIFNLDYLPDVKLEESKIPKQDMTDRTLILIQSSEKLDLNVTYMIDKKRFALTKNFYTIDQVSGEIADRFAIRQFESKNFNFGDGIVINELPNRDDIEKVIRKAMEKADIEGNKISENNKKRIELFFNQFLPKGKKKRVHVNVEGDINGIRTRDMDMASARTSELDRDTSIFISEDYEEELRDENEFVIKDFLKRSKGFDEQMVLDFAGTEESEYVRAVVKSTPLYAVNTSMFKTPLNLVIVSHGPERNFVFKLVEHYKYTDSWIKSRDMGFYSLSYEFWKGGKDRVRRSFNPDFFIKIDIEHYLSKITDEANSESIKKLRELQDQGIKEIIKVVEIKSDEDREEITRAKERFGKEHFENLNKQLRQINPIDLPEDFIINAYQYYTFDLLRPEGYGPWFSNLKRGVVS
jgi:type III restriction enzyme